MSRRKATRPQRDVCQLYCFNKALVRRLTNAMPDSEALEEVAALFSALGHRTRLLVLHCLSQADELCVCDIANTLGMNLSTVSHQLRTLRSAGLVTFRSEGKMAFYRLAKPHVGDLVRSEIRSAAVGVR